MENLRKAFTIILDDGFSTITLLKPFSDEYQNYLILISEDVYGEFTGSITPISEIRKRFSYKKNEINDVFKQLGILE